MKRFFGWLGRDSVSNPEAEEFETPENLTERETFLVDYLDMPGSRKGEFLSRKNHHFNILLEDIINRTGRKKWFKMAGHERTQILERSDLDNRASKRAFSENKEGWLQDYRNLQTQTMNELKNGLEAVRNKVRSNPESERLLSLYDQTISQIFDQTGGVRFGVFGNGNIRAEIAAGSRGHNFYTFDGQSKFMRPAESRFLHPDVDMDHTAIFPVKVGSSGQHDPIKLFAKIRQEFQIEDKKITLGISQSVRGEEGNPYLSDTRGGISYLVGLEFDANIEAAKRILEQVRQLNDSDFIHFMEMFADTFVPKYNRAIGELAERNNQ